jgi:hypothetical protein
VYECSVVWYEVWSMSVVWVYVKVELCGIVVWNMMSVGIWSV